MVFRAFLKDLRWRFRNLGVQKTNYGTRLKITSFMDHLVFKEIFEDKVYDEFILRALKKDSSKNVKRKIFDIGANLGFFTIRCCEIWNQLEKKSPIHFVIFEPSETCYRRLEQNLKLFKHPPFSFEIHNVLVGKKKGWDWFIEDEEHHLGQCVSEQIEKQGKRYSRKVPYKDLSEELVSSKINLLKCDIEGSEVEFLKNYSSYLKNVSSIIIETHGQKAKEFVCRKMKETNFVNFQKKNLVDQSLYSNLFFEKESTSCSDSKM